MSVYFAGNAQYGQCGLFIDDNKLHPTEISLPATSRQIEGGGKHAAMISEDGMLYTWGDNQMGQLGRTQYCKPNLVPAFETFLCTSCSLGQTHTAVVTNCGTLLTFGSNQSGELGTESAETMSDKPKAIHPKMGNSFKFVRTACGNGFTYALTEDGKVFSWGQNWDGQLGRGDFVSIKGPDTFISSLATNAIVSITCGQSHALFLSISGILYSCGSNSFGELGHGDDKKRFRPSPIEFHDKFCKIASGSFHNLAVTVDGKLYSWGSNSHGQLGHHCENSRSSPKLIDYFDRLRVTHIAAGSRHSLAIAIDDSQCIKKGIAYSWGCGASGQLGHGNTASQYTPLPIEALSNVNCVDVSCGFEFSFIMSDMVSKPILPPLLYFRAGEITQLGKDNLSALFHKIQVVFSSPSCLNASFLDWNPESPNYHYLTNESICGVDMACVRSSFTALIQLYEEHNSLMNVLANATGKLVQSLHTFSFNTAHSLRLFLILVEVPWMLQPAKYNPVIENLTRALIGLDATAKQTLRNWWSRLPSENAIRILHVFKGYLEFILSNEIVDTAICASIVLVLDLLHQATHRGKQIPHDHFAVPKLVQRINLSQDFLNYRNSSSRVFSFCQYPFLFNPQIKKKLIEIEASIEMREHLIRAVLQANEPFFTMAVHRDRVFPDVMNELVNYISELPEFPPSHLKKPLKVTFLGEDGIDDGGLQRELFYLLTEHMFSKDASLFSVEPESYFSWFSPVDHSLDHSQGSVTFPMETQYKLVGIILGMAIYNGIILNLRFPGAVYRLLLNKPVRLKDLTQLRPSVGNGLKQLLDMSAEDLEASNLTFEISDGGKVHELCSNGSNLVVTKDNVNLYVQLYCNFVLSEGVKLQLTALRDGFELICNGLAMKFLHPNDLEVFVCGSAKLDFHALEGVTKYIGYTVKSCVIQWFWEIIHALSYEEKRKFLLFVTGVPRAPMNGLENMNFTIQKSGPHSDRLPVAHTCYNILDLPDYESKEILQKKLLIAISNFHGFGIV